MEHARKVWERTSADEVRRILATDLTHGLHAGEVIRRRALYGKNTLSKSKKSGALTKFFNQFKNPLALVLVFAAVATLLLGEYVDTVVISLALIINVVIGTLQEERASRAFDLLNVSRERRAIVLREGKRQNVSVEELVPGDLVLLEGGYFVPADLRIVEEKDVRINEAALTGEWIAVEKSSKTLEKSVPLAERENMAWMGTLVESGYGRAVVVATGDRTELGAIAHSLAAESGATPLERNMQHIAHLLSYAVAGALVAIVCIGLLRQEPFEHMILIAIAVAVAVIPAGLPAALTVVLAIGMESILKRGGLVRNLLAAETLGATTVVLTDKTGTLTEGNMKLTSLHSYQGIHDHRETPRGDNRFLLELAVVSSDAFIEEAADAPSKLTVHGRPIEKAVVLAGLEAGIVQDELRKEYAQLDHLQFTSERRFAASLHKNPKKDTHRIILSGEPERLIAAAAFVRFEGRRIRMTDEERKRFLDLLNEKTSEGKRLIGVAYNDTEGRELPEGAAAKKILDDNVFAGILAFEDSVREDVAPAIREVRAAGADVIMLTGDNSETARYIARKVGISDLSTDTVIRGEELDTWDDTELYSKLQRTKVIARATPTHKLRIAHVLSRNGEVVAMTGDGINDAPALKAASIGIAVGSGCEVAKEASDLVLVDNSFSVIASAIEEGRRIIDNLKKIVAYLLSTSFSEIFVLAGALAYGAPLPLLPTQILWANIVGGDLMSFSFAFEKKDPNAMKRNPRSANAKNILTRELKLLVVLLSVITGILSVCLYVWLLARETPIEEIRTVMFVTLSLDALFFSFSLKSFDTPLWRIDFGANRHFLGAFAISVVLLSAALIPGPIMTLLSLAVLSGSEMFALFVIGLVDLAAIEVMKYVLFQRKR